MKNVDRFATAPNKRIEPEPVQAGGKNRRPLAQARLMQPLCASRKIIVYEDLRE